MKSLGFAGRCFAGVALCFAVVASPLCAADDEAGFTPIFDGKTLEGWIGAVDGYVAKDGAIVCEQKKGGNLFTAKQYANFVLRFDALIPKGGNNGVAVRSPNQPGSVAYDGMEIQMLDDDDEQYKSIKPYQFHGSVYGIVAAKTGARKPAGEWNEHEITLDGRRVKVVVNGQTVVDADLDEVSKDGTVDGKKHPGLTRKKGHIGFLGHGHAVAYRNLRIKELK